MAIVGLKMVKIALVNKDNQQLIKGEGGLSTDGVIAIDSKMLGTRTANISNLEGQVTKIPGNNSVQDATIAPGSPTVAFDFNNLDFVIKQKILGYKSDGKGGYVKQDDKPHVAVLIESETIDRKNSVFFGFANGIMQEPTQNVATDTDTSQTRQDDHLTYNALSAIAFGNEPFKKYFSGDSKFDKANMYKEVFGGYVFTGDGVGH